MKGDGYFEARLVAINKEEILGIVRYLTEQKSTEKELEIEKIKLAAAEEADKLKSAFLANMSHEIRTPMNAIIGFSNLLRDTDVSEEEKQEYIEIINKSGDHLIHLIDDIIDISKIEAGQMIIKKDEIQVNSILTDLYQFFDKDKKAKKKNDITLCLNIPKKQEDLKIVTDGYRFRQILFNLLSNSMKFTEKGMIEFGYIINHEQRSTINVQRTTNNEQRTTINAIQSAIND